MRCPVCGTISLGRRCSGCGISLESKYALTKISGRLYNEGLEYAREGQLEHARQFLRKAVRYNPDNISARNVLGLVYMETGEIGDAVREWTKSAELDPEAATNPAVDYLKRVSRTMGRAAQLKEAVRLYNQALELLRDGHMDTALLHLKKAVAQSENFVRGKELLALCYMRQGQYFKAAQMLNEAEAVDREDPMLPRLKQLYREVSVQEHPEKKEEAETAPVSLTGKTHKRSVRSYLGQNASMTQFLLFAFGLTVGILLMNFLVTPDQMASLRQECNVLNQQLSQYQEAQKEEDTRLEDLQTQLTFAAQENHDLRDEYKAYQTNASALLRAAEYYHQGDGENMREELAKVDPQTLTNEQRLVYDWLNHVELE